MSEITLLLAKARDGDETSLKAVFDRLYKELRAMAGRRLAGRGGTLTPTVLVHEAYLRLIGAEALELNDRRHFFACAARAMRHVLLDHARRSAAQKRGGELQRVTWTDSMGKGRAVAVEVLDLDRALDELVEVNPRARKVVDLRFFAGRSAEETAELLDLSLRTVHREWQKGRAFLHARLQDEGGPEPA